VKRASRFSGEQIAQVTNPDPFAIPVWRSPVYRTSLLVIVCVQVARLAGKTYRLVRHHPVLTLTTALWWLWRRFGWPAPVFLASVIVTMAGVWWCLWPASFSRLVLRPAYGQWQRGRYQRHWAAVMTISRLASAYQGRLLLPVLGKVASTRYTDRVAIRLVSGQSAEDYARRADNLAHGFGAVTCRVRSAKPGRLVLEFVRRDALAQIIPALPIPAAPNLRALPVGKREDGQPVDHRPARHPPADRRVNRRR
jgi:S-DNA-T family DNA segregation ATPase FtsK/SpoIIIE